MNAFCEKNGVTEEQFKSLLKSGAISCLWPFWNEVIETYNSLKSKNGSVEAVKMTADKFNIEERSVYRILKY